MTPLIRLFLLLGVVFLIVAGLLYLLDRLNISIGRLPGDIRIERGNFSFHFPLASSILISILLTILLNILIRLFGRR